MNSRKYEFIDTGTCTQYFICNLLYDLFSGFGTVKKKTNVLTKQVFSSYLCMCA